MKTLTADAAGAEIAPAGGNAYRIAASAHDLKVVPADGRAIPAIDGEARITALDFGSSLGTDPTAAILAWLRAGGTAHIDRLSFAAGGASAEADGQLTLSPDGLLTGALNVRLRNPSGFADFAEAIKPGSRDKMGQVLTVVAALTVPVDTPDGPARQTTLVFRNSVVAIGILPVGVIPPLEVLTPLRLFRLAVALAVRPAEIRPPPSPARPR